MLPKVLPPGPDACTHRHVHITKQKSQTDKSCPPSTPCTGQTQEKKKNHLFSGCACVCVCVSVLQPPYGCLARTPAHASLPLEQTAASPPALGMLQCWDQCRLLAAMCVRYVCNQRGFPQNSQEAHRLPFCLPAGRASREGGAFHMLFASWVLNSAVVREWALCM